MYEHPAQTAAHELAPIDRPIVLFPGYTWDSEQSLSPFAAALSEAGHTVVSGQYYDGLLPDFAELPYQPKDATDRLAIQMLATIKRAGLEHTPLTVVAHSYGALIYNRAFEMARTLGWESLAPPEGETRETILLAPSGTLEGETMPRIMARYASNLGTLAVQTKLGKPFRTQQKRLLSEPVTRLREAYRLANDTVDYADLATTGVHVHIVESGSDTVFPETELAAAASKLPLASTSALADRSASHSDILLNPARNTQVIDSILRAA